MCVTKKGESLGMLPKHLGRGAQVLERISKVLRRCAALRPTSNSALSRFSFPP